MATVTAHIIPHEVMLYSQGVDTIFVPEVVGLILCPVGKVVWLIISPSIIPFIDSVIQSNPALGAVQTMLNIDVLLLISNAGEVCAV